MMKTILIALFAIPAVVGPCVKVDGFPGCYEPTSCTPLAAELDARCVSVLGPALPHAALCAATPATCKSLTDASGQQATCEGWASPLHVSCCPETCDGCVDNNGHCQPGTTTTQCGDGGQACQSCGGLTCENGACASSARGDQDDAAYCQIVSRGS